jgi:DNA-binding MarR family transcriptional regulator
MIYFHLRIFLLWNIMVDDSQRQADDSRIASLVHDFQQIGMKFDAMLPRELEQLLDLLDGIQIGDKPNRFINCNLFYRTSFNLYRVNNMTMSELGQALSVPFSTATRMVDWFVDNGYAQRLPDPEDRRVVRVALTDSGRELYQTIERYMVQHFRLMLSPLTVKEQNILLTIMEKVVRGIQETER